MRPLRRPAPQSGLVTGLLAALCAITPLSIDMPLPALPQIAEGLGAPNAHAQLTISVFLAGFGLMQLVLGPLSDRFGRRPVMFFGLGLYILASGACAVAGDIGLLIAGRFIQGAGACAAPVLARAAVRDIHAGPRVARVLSVMASATALAPVIAPLIGSQILAFAGWRQIYIMLGASGALMLLAAWALLAETNRNLDPRAMEPRRLAASYGKLLRHPSFRRYAATNCFTGAGLFSFLSGAPFVLIDGFGVSPSGFAVAFAIVVAGLLSGTFTSSRLTMTLGIDRMLATGSIITVTGGAAMLGLALAGIAHPAAVIGPMVVFMAGFGMVLPNSTAGAINPFPGMAGTASALLGCLQMSSAAGIGAVVGHLYDGTARPMAAMILAMALGGFAVVRLSRTQPT